MHEKVAVIGYGVTGQAALQYLCAQDKLPVVIDTRPQPDVDLPEGPEYYFEQSHWPEVDVAYGILSPGLAMESCLVQEARAAGVSLLSDIDVFFDAVDQPVVGITGTNGKSTVTSWVAHCLNRAGLDARAGGNLGEAALALAMQPAEFYVLELSSFQLERSRLHSYHVATVLNVSEDHIDQHGDMEHYIAAKQRINQRAKTVVVNRQDEATNQTGIALSGDPGKMPARVVSFGLDEPITDNDWGVIEQAGVSYIARGRDLVMPINDVSLVGEHNLLNALATAAIVAELLSVEMVIAGLSSFAGLPHRFEYVALTEGVTFINDSKATNVGACAAALAGFPRDARVVLVAGGDAKGGDISALAPAFEGRVKAIVALGKDAHAFQDLARATSIACDVVATLPEAVHKAYARAEEGDTVLLSPACASLDMFASYIARGETFKSAVRELSVGVGA